MIYTKETKKALEICYQAHAGQRDKAGAPYVFHPFHVAEQMRCADGVCVALLHDVIEDTDVSADDLRQAGMGEEVVTAVELLTRDRSEPRADYIARIKENPLARAVKLADLRHNSDLSRLDTITDRDLRRYEQYQREIAVLEGV